jgi:SAM-dependent methyltransferase
MRSAPVNQQPDVIRFFGGEAAHYQSYYDGQDSQAETFATRSRLVMEMLRPVPPGRVLDVGCGPGVLIERLLQAGHRVEGVDITPEMIAQCEQRFGTQKEASFSVGKAEALAAPDETYDAITCVGVIGYLDAEAPALREMHRTLKAHGRLVIACPHRFSPWRRWTDVCQGVQRWLRGDRTAVLRRREYSAAECITLLQECGFKPLDLCYFGLRVMPHPLDRLYPRLAGQFVKILEGQGRSWLRLLGVGFVVAAVKSANPPPRG